MCKGDSVSETSISFVIRENNGSFIAFVEGFEDTTEQEDEPPRKKAKEMR